MLNKPTRFRIERLEERQMMSVTPLHFDAAALTPAYSSQVTASKGSLPMDGGIVLDDSPAAPVPAFSSLPGAPATLYLDFDGHFQDVAAVTGAGANRFSPAFALDGDHFNWSAETNAIREIWARVAEDYAPFNINVTTINPGDFSHGSHNLRVVITGENFTALDTGGVGRVNSFSRANDPNVVYVFSLSKGVAADDPAGLRALRTIGNLASHEAAHALGLEHQLDKGDSTKAPIMNNANGPEVRGVWWKGANEKGVLQDDMAVIARAENGFGFRPDENNHSFAEPEQLNYVGSALAGRGIIGSTGDVDVFRFDTRGGRLEVFVEGAVVDSTNGRVNIGNLDVVVELFNNKGQLLGRGDPANRTDAALDISNLPASNYFVKVSSKGAVGDVGQFRLIVEELDPPRVVSSEFVNLGADLAGVWIEFNKPIKADTFTTADVKATGVSILSVTADLYDPRRFLVTMTVPTIALSSLTVGPDIRDLRQGNQMMDQNRDGVQGTTADVYRVYFTGSLAILDQVMTTTPKSKTALTSRLVDAAFAR